LQRYMSDFRLNVEVHVKSIDQSILNASSFVTRGQSASAADEPDPSSSPSKVKRFASWPIANVHLQAVDPELSEAPRGMVSGPLPMLPRIHSGFPELPPSSTSVVRNISVRTTHEEPVAISSATESLPSAPNDRSVVHKVHPVSDSGVFLEEGSSIEKEEFELLSGLNQIIQSESTSADLVVTNLPDMPPGASIHGYFTLIEELTRGLQRCLLARGTATEVITAFT